MNMMNAIEVRLDRDRFDKCFEMMCDDYCHWPVVSASQDVLNKHCDECDDCYKNRCDSYEKEYDDYDEAYTFFEED